MKRLIPIILLLLAVATLWAVPAAPYLLSVTQPDGSQLNVRLVGDEDYSYYTLEDGTPIRQNDKGFWIEDPSVVPSKEFIQKKRDLRRAQKQVQIGGGFPHTGEPHALVLLIGYKDLPFEQKLEDFDALLNESGYAYDGATGSCRDYFIASSDSLFAPKFDVYGPYTADFDMDHYGAKVGENHDIDPYSLIIEACKKAAAAGVKLSDYDTNGDGVLDNVFVYYAGHNQAEGGGENTIWPHQSNLSWRNIEVDGVRLATYACTSEYSGPSGNRRASIGTFCHEFGHVLSLPDFYDTEYRIYTVADWDIMCSGAYNNNGKTPPVYTSYERFYLGWLKPKQLDEKGVYYLEPLETSNEAYLIAADKHNLQGDNPTPNEFFMLEYRANVGWDTHPASMPGTGMLVWHIDYSATAWNLNTPNCANLDGSAPDFIRMHLEEANGMSWKDRDRNASGSPADPYPGTMGVTTFTPTLHNGEVLSDQPIFDIVEVEKNKMLSFTYKAAGLSQLTTDKKSISLTTSLEDETNKIIDWEPQSFMLSGKSIDPKTDVTLRVSGDFNLYIGETAPERKSTEWKQEGKITPNVDSTLLQKIWLSFEPRRQNCEAVTSTFAASAKGVNLSMPISGRAPRPQYVHTPELKPTTLISPYSFCIAWKPVFDAEEYYITLYQTKEGSTSFMQSFENFDNPTSILEEGWETTTNEVTTAVRSEGLKALVLKKTNDMITSEEYLAPITSISYWVNAYNADVDTIGYLTLEAWNGNEWHVIDKKPDYISRLAKGQTITKNFEETDAYTRFRLTYTDMGGKGLALDAFTANCSKEVKYLYRGRELMISPWETEEDSSYNVSGLTPSTDYYYRIQCTDLGKGCEEYLTPLSAPVKVTTLAGVGEDDTKHLTFAVDSISFDTKTYVVYIPNPSNNGVIYIYDTAGRLVYNMPTETGLHAYPVPEEQLTRRNIYIIKYVDNSKMKRKQRWVKFAL